MKTENMYIGRSDGRTTSGRSVARRGRPELQDFALEDIIGSCDWGYSDDILEKILERVTASDASIGRPPITKGRLVEAPVLINGVTRELIDGNHRVAQAIVNGDNTVPAYVLQTTKELEAFERDPEGFRDRLASAIEHQGFAKTK